jgi:hypothetical protein
MEDRENCSIRRVELLGRRGGGREEILIKTC